MTCKPCRVTYQGQRYQIGRNGSVTLGHIIEEPSMDGSAQPTGEIIRTMEWDVPVDAQTATAVRREAARQRRNKTSQERYRAMRDVGMTKTPYGWE